MWHIIHTQLIYIKKKNRKNGKEDRRNEEEEVMSYKAIFSNCHILISMEK